MKITASKKTTTVLILSVALLILATVAISFLPRNEEPDLQKLIEYCSSGEEGDCPLLLYKEEVGDTQRCFSARIPKVTAEDTNESTTFCIENSLIEWKNPYPDYESFVPVNVYIEKKFGIFSSVKKVSFNLIEDKDIDKLIPNLRFTRNEKIVAIMSKEQFEINEKGYYLSNMKFEEEQKPYITIFDTWLGSYTAEDDGTLTLVLNIVTKQGVHKVVAKEKSFLFIVNPMIDDYLIINTSNIEEFSLKMKECISYFSVDSKEKPLTEENIDTYYTRLLDNNEEVDKEISLKLLYCPY